MSYQRINLGKKGEELVAKYLEKNNFIIIEKNFSSKYGEVDIIAQKDNVIAFVEVKLRQNPAFYLSELITGSKQNKIIKTALWYIGNNNFSDMIFRFDVALLEPIKNDYKITYIENAFAPKDY